MHNWGIAARAERELAGRLAAGQADVNCVSARSRSIYSLPNIDEGNIWLLLEVGLINVVSYNPNPDGE